MQYQQSTRPPSLTHSKFLNSTWLLSTLTLVNLLWASLTWAFDTPQAWLDQLKDGGMARVIVVLNVPFQAEGTLGEADAIVAQRMVIAQAQQMLLDSLQPQGTADTRFETIPALVMDVDGAMLTQLGENPLVASLQPDVAEEAMAGVMIVDQLKELERVYEASHGYPPMTKVTVSPASADDGDVRGWMVANLQSVGIATVARGEESVSGRPVRATTSAPCGGVTTGLVACYPFDDNANDDSGTGNNGILQGNVKFVDGVIGKAIRLDGTGYIRVPHSSSLEVNHHTIAAWVSLSTGGAVVGKLAPKAYETLHLSARGQKIATGFTTGTEMLNHPVSSTNPVRADGWHFIVLTYDGAEVRFYIDGVIDGDLNNQTPRTGTVRINAKELAIGRHCGNPEEVDCDDPLGLYTGLIDEVRIYNRALSGPEVQTLYQLVPFSCANVGGLPQAECETLVELHKSTQGTGWTDSATNNWLKTNTPCRWTGITCANGHVTKILREAQNLIGTLPDLSALTALQVINLSKNQITGSLPNLSNTLKELRMADNQLTGELPKDLAVQYQNLQAIDLKINHLSGVIPDLSQLTQLIQLDVWGNQLTGSIPNLPKLLRTLNLGNNKLEGEIPDLSPLTDLRVLNLSYNNFSEGPVPDLSKFPNLWYVRLVHTNRTGPVPAELSNLVLLQMLDFSDNGLTGQIPNLDKLTRLEYVGFASNKLEGAIPSLNTLVNLKELLLADNSSLCRGAQNDYAGRTEVEVFPICEEPTKVSLTVTKSGDGTVTGQGIDCGTDCTEDHAPNTPVTLTATAATGASFQGWTGDCTGTGTTVTVTMDQAKTCTATFEKVIPKYTLTVSKTGTGMGDITGTGLDCGTDCTEDYTAKIQITLTATPAAGSQFLSWGGDCTGTATTVTMRMTQAKSCTANFLPDATTSYTLTAVKGGTGTGTIRGQLQGQPVNLLCKSTCPSSSYNYPAGSVVSLTATSDAGFTFKSWTCEGSYRQTSKSALIKVTMDVAKTCTAEFQ